MLVCVCVFIQTQEVCSSSSRFVFGDQVPDQLRPSGGRCSELGWLLGNRWRAHLALLLPLLSGVWDGGHRHRNLEGLHTEMALVSPAAVGVWLRCPR